MSISQYPTSAAPGAPLARKFSDLPRQLSAALKSDPRKAWLLTVLLTVLLVLWGKVLIGTRGPTDALAGHPALVAVAGPGRPMRRGEPLLSLADWARKPVSPMDRNLFAIPFDYYPQDGARAPQASRSLTDQGFWDELAKSMSAQADQKKERQILVDNLRTQAASLTLQGTVLGNQPKAWVNGSLVGVGDSIGSVGFRVVRIEARRILVEREGVRLEIPMK